MLNIIINISFSLIVSAGLKNQWLGSSGSGSPRRLLVSVSLGCSHLWRLAWGWRSFQGALSRDWQVDDSPLEPLIPLPHHSTIWAFFQHGHVFPLEQVIQRGEGGNGDVFCGLASEIAHCHCHTISSSQGSTMTEWEEGLHGAWEQESEVHC